MKIDNSSQAKLQRLKEEITLTIKKREKTEKLVDKADREFTKAANIEYKAKNGTVESISHASKVKTPPAIENALKCIDFQRKANIKKYATEEAMIDAERELEKILVKLRGFDVMKESYELRLEVEKMLDKN